MYLYDKAIDQTGREFFKFNTFSKRALAFSWYPPDKSLFNGLISSRVGEMSCIS